MHKKFHLTHLFTWLVLAAALLALACAGVAGYRLFDVVRIRIDAWLNPWLDASGRSYQVVQSLLAVANGGLFGRGPGLGSPSLVPVPQSDFIFVAIVEEAGLLGAIGLLRPDKEDGGDSQNADNGSWHGSGDSYGFITLYHVSRRSA